MKTKLHLPYILLCLFFFLHFASYAADGKYHVAFYDRWTDLSSRQLTDMARKYMDTPNMSDSALVCYTVVANRYYEHVASKDELYLCVNAMANLGYLYSSQYFDYQKAYSYLKQSLDIAEKERFNRLLSYIYLNLGVLSGTYEDLRGHNTYSKETLSYLNSAYRMSLENKEWRAALYCLSDILEIKFEQRKSVQGELAQLSRFKAKSEPLYRYVLNMCKGIDAYLRKDYAASSECFREMMSCVPKSEKGNKEVLQFKSMRYQAAVLEAQARHDDAVVMLKDIARKAHDGKMMQVEVWIYKVLYEYFDALGKKVESDEYQLKYYKAKESLSISGHIESIGQLKFLYQLKVVDDKVKAISVKREQQQLIFVISTVALLAIIIALLLSLRYYHKQKNYIQKLYDKNVALLKLRDDVQVGNSATVSVKGSTVDNVEKYASSGLDDQSKEKLLNSISEVIGNTQAICSPDFSIKQLSEMIGSNTTYVSQVINEKYGMNFKSLLNERRIAEACRRLSDTKEYGNLTIEAIALGVGFKSRTNFTLVFKKITGLSASEFQRAALRNRT